MKRRRTQEQSQSQSVTFRRTKRIDAENTVVVEEKHTRRLTVREQVEQQCLKEYADNLQQVENQRLSHHPTQIIRNNPYLYWRQQQIHRSCQSLIQWDSTCFTRSPQYVYQNRTKHVQGLEFVARFPWSACLEFARLFEIDESEFLASCFINKVLLGQRDQPWPRCVSPMGEINKVFWKLEQTVAVVSNMTFLWGSTAPVQFQGRSFTCPKHYFPLDLLLIVEPDLFRESLTQERRVFLSRPNNNLAFRSYVQQRLKDHKK